MKRFVLFFNLMLVTSSLFVGTAQNVSDQKLVGDWKYEVSQAPYGFEKGTIVFSNKEDVISGEVVFGSGYQVKLQELTFNKDTLMANAYVDGEYVSITAHIKKDIIEGKVNTSMGVMGLKAKKIKVD